MFCRLSVGAAAVLVAASLAACSAGETKPNYKESSLHFSNLPEIESISFKSVFHGAKSAVNRPLTGGEPAYDYSVHIIRDGDRYRMYTGGRWKRPGIERADGDHVMQYVSPTGAGGTWTMPRDRPEFWNGAEQGKPGEWYAGNCLEPEVMKVNGTYYLYTQVEITKDGPIDIPGRKATAWADRIQLFTSRNGSDWTRFAARGVVVNMDAPENTALHHQELVYVPWDKDKRPFWLYVGVNLDGVFTGYSRIRSADPRSFDWRLREKGAGFSQLGNQLAYARQAPGGPLFVRITFTGDASGRHVPSLQFSRDGMAWFSGDEGPVLLDGSKDNDKNRNCYFLGISTIDGTGELEYLGNNTYRAIYGATTSNSPGGGDIWYSEIGAGELIFTITPKAAG